MIRSQVLRKMLEGATFRMLTFVTEDMGMIKSRSRPAMAAIAAVLGVMLWPAPPASALTMKECSAKYDAAKKANTLNGAKWNDFRKAQCGDTASAAKSTAASAAVFPKAIDPKFAKESPGKARLHTCSAQYNANKAGGGNGGMKWIEKGGGYWSACNKVLKGA